jgi:hypothetical protein
MGVDKNSSRRMNSAYFPNSQLRIATRVCQRHVLTTDLPTVGANPNSKQYGSTTQEAKDLGNPWCLGQTVRSGRVGGPRDHGEWSTRPRLTVREIYPNNQYCTLKYRRSVPYPRTVREQPVPHGQSETKGRTIRKPPATKTYQPLRSKHL